MPLTLRRSLLACGFAAGLAAVPARAATTPQQAQALADQLQAWLVGTLGADFPPPPHALQVTPQDDGYAVAWPLGLLPGVATEAGSEVSATVRPLDRGRWSIDAIRLPNPMTLTVTAPAGGKASGPVHVTWQVAGQQAEGVLDPSLASPSSLTFRLTGTDLTVDGPRVSQRSHFDAMTVQAGLVPAAVGRADVTEEASGENYSSTQRDQHGEVQLAARSIHASGHLTGLDLARAEAALHAGLHVVSEALALRGTDVHERRDAVLRPAVVAFLRSLRDLTSGGELSETLEALRVVSGEHRVAVDRLGVGTGWKARDGLLSAQVSLVADGVRSPEIPGEFRAYVPRHVLVRPMVAGVSLTAVDDLLNGAAAPAADRPGRLAAALAALFAAGPPSVGIDALEIDLGPAKVRGAGVLVADAPDDLRGQAEVTATGFDALLDQIRADPKLASALPVLATIRLLARPEGDRLIWDITFRHGDLLINGTDITALLGLRHHHHE